MRQEKLSDSNPLAATHDLADLYILTIILKILPHTLEFKSLDHSAARDTVSSALL